MNSWGDPSFSVFLAKAYLGLITVMWALLVIGLKSWGARWRIPLPTEDAPEEGALVSICVPARNEALNIETCVRAALASRWPNLELVIVDDRSEDGTGDAARKAAEGDPRLVVIEGTEPQPGWAGKAWACCRAASEARGELLLFIDADVALHPDAVRATVSRCASGQLAMLSVFGTWSLQTFWERAVIPAVGWLIRGVVPLDLVNHAGRIEAFANGQFILIRRDSYDALDGHAAVRDQILDDVRLAEVVKRRGEPIGLFVAPWAFKVRLYRSLAEILAGYSKNLYEGMGRRPSIGLGAILFIFVGTLFPFMGLLAGLVMRFGLGWGVPGTIWLVWLAAICGLQFIFRFRLERWDGRSGAAWWTHPLANLVLVWILFRSVFGVEASWKGRRFVDGKAV